MGQGTDLISSPPPFFLKFSKGFSSHPSPLFPLTFPYQSCDKHKHPCKPLSFPNISPHRKHFPSRSFIQLGWPTPLIFSSHNSQHMGLVLPLFLLSFGPFIFYREKAFISSSFFLFPPFSSTTLKTSSFAMSFLLSSYSLTVRNTCIFQSSLSHEEILVFFDMPVSFCLHSFSILRSFVKGSEIIR